MFRYSIYGQVQMGKWRQFFELYEKLDEQLQAKKLVRRQLWAPTVGTNNSFVLVADHETIDGWDRDSTAFQTDGEVMDLWRKIFELLEESPTDELMQTASQIA